MNGGVRKSRRGESVGGWCGALKRDKAVDWTIVGGGVVTTKPGDPPRSDFPGCVKTSSKSGRPEALLLARVSGGTGESLSMKLALPANRVVFRVVSGIRVTIDVCGSLAASLVQGDCSALVSGHTAGGCRR